TGRGYVMLPTWVGVVSAISLAIIAVAALVTAAGITAAALGVWLAVKALKGFAGPAIADVRQLIGSIRTEADALVGTSRDVRQRIVRAVDAAEERLTSLDALAEVVQEELEETALDAAASMAKKYAPVGRHCHAWHVGQEIFDLAPSDPLRAFGLGYLSHLAADTIAHNFFVPRQLVLTSSTVALGHSYWESRFETHLGDAY